MFILIVAAFKFQDIFVLLWIILFTLIKIIRPCVKDKQKY